MGEEERETGELLREANAELVRAALAAKEAAQREQALREEIQAQNKRLRIANDALIVAQLALGASERRYRSLFEQLAEGFTVHEIILDEYGQPYDYRFLDVNPAFERLTGLSRDVVGRTVRDVLPAVEQYWIDIYGEVVLTGQPVRLESYSEPLGKHFEVIAFSPERGRFAALLVDITERKRAEQEREQLLRQKDEFLSVAAHELKTPVTSLRGFAQTILRQYEKRGAMDPARLGRALQVIDQQSNKLAKLVSQLLDVSRLEGGRLALQRRQVDLVRLVKEVAAAARSSTNRHTLVVEAPSRAAAFVDPLRIEQVITNLVDNAIRYSPDGGPIEIKVTAGDGAVQIAVRDHGIGIPPVASPHVFERFYRAHEGGSIAGMGLGLFISKEIVTLHGGRIEFACPPDGGARFVVSLPLGSGDAEEKGR